MDCPEEVMRLVFGEVGMWMRSYLESIAGGSEESRRDRVGANQAALRSQWLSDAKRGRAHELIKLLNPTPSLVSFGVPLTVEVSLLEMIQRRTISDSYSEHMQRYNIQHSLSNDAKPVKSENLGNKCSLNNNFFVSP